MELDGLVSECVTLGDDGWGEKKKRKQGEANRRLHTRGNTRHKGPIFSRLDLQTFLLSRLSSEGENPLMADSFTSTVVSRDQYVYSSQHIQCNRSKKREIFISHPFPSPPLSPRWNWVLMKWVDTKLTFFFINFHFPLLACFSLILFSYELRIWKLRDERKSEIAKWKIFLCAKKVIENAQDK